MIDKKAPNHYLSLPKMHHRQYYTLFTARVTLLRIMFGSYLLPIKSRCTIDALNCWIGFVLNWRADIEVWFLTEKII